MRRNPLEWIVLISSLAAVIALVGYLLVAGLTGPSPGVRLTTRVEDGAPDSAGTGWLVPVTVVNDGNEAAIGVVLEASGVVDGEDISRELTVDLVPPGGSSVELVVRFDSRPDGDVEAQILGFERP